MTPNKICVKICYSYAAFDDDIPLNHDYFTSCPSRGFSYAQMEVYGINTTRQERIARKQV